MTVFENITKKGRKQFYFRFKIDKKEYYKVVKEATCKNDAEKAEAVFKSELLRGNYGLVEKRGSMMFEELVDKYKSYAKNNKKTWETELCKVRKIEQYFKGKRLKDITPSIIEEYKNYRKNSRTYRGTTTNTATVNRDLAMIKKMFSIAVNNKWIDENPALNCRVPMFQENNEIIRYLTDEQEVMLLLCCDKEYAYLKPIVLTAIHTGMRFGEIMNLTWKRNIDMKNRYIRITKEMAKSKKQRIIPLSSVLFEELLRLKENCDGEYLFPNPKTGKPYADIRRAWATVKSRAGIDPEFRFHDLRHHTATKLMDKNVNVSVIKDILGHSSLLITQKYAHAKDTTKRAAMELLATH